MNERIKELAEQARVKDHWSCDENRYLTNYLQEEKFARLIIAECCTIADDTVVGLPSDDIEKHFGVYDE